MKLNEKLNQFCDRVDGFLRRFCGAMSPDTRLIVIVIMIVLFGGINIYLTVRAIYQAGRADERKELIEINHITPLDLQNKKDLEINPLKNQENERPEQEER